MKKQEKHNKQIKKNHPTSVLSKTQKFTLEIQF